MLAETKPIGRDGPDILGKQIDRERVAFVDKYGLWLSFGLHPSIGRYHRDVFFKWVARIGYVLRPTAQGPLLNSVAEDRCKLDEPTEQSAFRLNQFPLHLDH